MKHKHSEIIKAFADGVQCEYLGERTNKWCDIKELVTFDAYETVRIKPEPQQEQEPQYLYLYRHTDTREKLMSPTLMQDTSDWDYIGKVRLEK
jgi:hypothetical protein